MKLKKLIYSAAAIAISLTACKDKSAFTIFGELKNYGKANKVYLLAADTSQVVIVDSAQITADGKFQFKHAAPYANLFKLRTSGAIFDLIAKNGDNLTFKTDLADSTHAYQISGSDESEKIKDFNKISNVYGEKNSKLVAEYQEKAEHGGNADSLLKIYSPVFMKNIKAYSDAVLGFINDNKESLASFYAATSLDPARYETEMVKYADDIRGQFKDNPAVQKFIKQMDVIKPVSVGHQAPEFNTTSLDGKPVKLSDYKGKYVLVDFWASWCVPCRQENPNVVKMYSQYHNKGLNILGISLDTEKSDWKKAIDADKLVWEHASDLKKFDGPTETLFHIEAIPSNFFIDPKGTIIAKNVTGPDLEEILKKTFDK